MGKKTYVWDSASSQWVAVTGATVYPAADTSGTAGIVALTDSVSSTSTTTAATPNSVKTTYDLASGKAAKAGDTFTGSVTAPQVTLTGGDSTTGTDTASLNLVGGNSRGGAGYHGFLDVKNTSAGATNPKKFLRLNQTGGLEIVNNAYSSTILSLTDGGNLTVPGYVTSGTSATQYSLAGGSTSTTLNATPATYTAVTSHEVSFTPSFTGQKFSVVFACSSYIGTATVQYLLYQINVTDSANTTISTLGYAGASVGQGTTIANIMPTSFSAIWASDGTAARKIKIYARVQTTASAVLTTAYTNLQVVPIS